MASAIFFPGIKVLSHFIVKGIVAGLFNFKQLEDAQDIKYIHILSWLVLVLLLSSLGLLLLTLFWRQYHRYIQFRNKRINTSYEARLIEFLFSDSQPQLRAQFIGLKGYRKRLFIDVLVQLNLQFAGHLNEKLRALFMETCHASTLQHVLGYSRTLKVSGLRVLSHMRAGISGARVEQLMDSTYPAVRMESLIAFSSLNPEDTFGLLEKTREKISEWEQMNLYNNLINNLDKCFDYSKYLSSGNTAILVLSLRLLGAGNPEGLYEKVLPLLSHGCEEVRRNAYNTLNSFKLINGVNASFKRPD